MHVFENVYQLAPKTHRLQPKTTCFTINSGLGSYTLHSLCFVCTLGIAWLDRTLQNESVSWYSYEHFIRIKILYYWQRNAWDEQFVLGSPPSSLSLSYRKLCASPTSQYQINDVTFWRIDISFVCVTITDTNTQARTHI